MEITDMSPFSFMMGIKSKDFWVLDKHSTDGVSNPGSPWVQLSSDEITGVRTPAAYSKKGEVHEDGRHTTEGEGNFPSPHLISLKYLLQQRTTVQFAADFQLLNGFYHQKSFLYQLQIQLYIMLITDQVYDEGHI